VLVEDPELGTGFDNENDVREYYINPTITTTLPSGGSPAVLMPPILEKYANMLFQVHQSSTALSRSPHIHYVEPEGSMI
jgi:hypothetical protein